MVKEISKMLNVTRTLRAYEDPMSELIKVKMIEELLIQLRNSKIMYIKKHSQIREKKNENT